MLASQAAATAARCQFQSPSPMPPQPSTPTGRSPSVHARSPLAAVLRMSPSLRARSPQLSSAVEEEESEESEDSFRSQPVRARVARFYNSFRVQMFVACLIGANFLTNIIEKEIDPHGTNYENEFIALEYVYNILFTMELGINMYSHCCCSFWRSGWNIFDVVVVTIGIINMVHLPLPDSFRMLRMMRAFRVLRLFKRVRSLNKIIIAIAHAVPGVINAFLLLTIVMCIYAILAVEFFINVGDQCHEADSGLEPSLRGRCFGEEYFGSFSKSLYSFFQVLTGESWSEAIARPVLWWYTDPWLSLGSAVFFVSFVLISAFVLTNVVVAVLLDKMVEAEAVSEFGDKLCDPAEFAVEERSVATEPGAADSTGSNLVAIENQIRLLTQCSMDMRADLDGTKREMREQISAVLAAVTELKCQRLERV